jgi:hypothetical protein
MLSRAVPVANNTQPEDLRRVEVQTHTFLISIVGGVESSPSDLDALPLGKSLLYVPIGQVAGWDQSRSGRSGEEKEGLAPPGIDPRSVGSSAYSLVIIETDPSRLKNYIRDSNIHGLQFLIREQNFSFSV